MPAIYYLRATFCFREKLRAGGVVCKDLLCQKACVGDVEESVLDDAFGIRVGFTSGKR